jgi:hypothetical protein
MPLRYGHSDLRLRQKPYAQRSISTATGDRRPGRRQLFAANRAALRCAYRFYQSHKSAASRLSRQHFHLPSTGRIEPTAVRIDGSSGSRPSSRSSRPSSRSSKPASTSAGDGHRKRTSVCFRRAAPAPQSADLTLPARHTLPRPTTHAATSCVRFRAGSWNRNHNPVWSSLQDPPADVSKSPGCRCTPAVATDPQLDL